MFWTHHTHPGHIQLDTLEHKGHLKDSRTQVTLNCHAGEAAAS